MKNLKNITNKIIIGFIVICGLMAVAGYAGANEIDEDVRRQELQADVAKYSQTMEIHKQTYDDLKKMIDAKESYYGSQKKKAQTKLDLSGSFQIPTKKIAATTYFTSYNPVSWQTDSSPCIGASGLNQCVLDQQGERIIALSQDLVSHGGKQFKYGEQVYLQDKNNDPRCTGYFTVLDTMNKRYTNRGDIFIMDKSQNLDCTADIYKLI